MRYLLVILLTLAIVGCGDDDSDDDNNGDDAEHSCSDAIEHCLDIADDDHLCDCIDEPGCLDYFRDVYWPEDDNPCPD